MKIHLRTYLSILFWALMSGSVLMAQAPVINSISSQSTYPGDQIVIAGAGFNTDKARMRVIFGSVAGTVLKSSAFSMEVLVPTGSRVSNIEVINLQTGLSVKSNNRFAPWFSGSGFASSAFVTEQTTPSSDYKQFKSNGPEFYDVCSCDFDGDGKPDLAASRYNIEQKIKVLRNTSTVGNISFVELDFSTGTQVTDQILCGDLNGDGLPEIIASPSDKVNKGIITLLPNRSTSGNISFGAAQQILLPSAKAYARSIAIRDLNNDGKPELVIANSYKPAAAATAPDNVSPVYIYMNQSSGATISFSSPPMELLLPRYLGTYSLEIQDFDLNGLPDIAVAEFQSNSVYFFPNKSTNFISFGTPVTKQIANAVINKLSSADFNGDGKPDLAVADFFNNRVDIFLNNSTGGSISFASTIENAVGKGPGGIDVVDIDGDRDVDLVVACRSEAKVTVLINSGASTPTFTRTDLTTLKNVRSLNAGDLDGDAKPDLALVSFKTPADFSLDIYRNKSCFTPQIINEAPLTNCPGQSIKLETVPGYGVSYSWKKDDVMIATTAIPNTSVSAAGSYTVTAVGECAATSATSAAITLNTTPTGSVPSLPTISGGPLFCESSTISLSVSTVANASYLWTGPNGFSSTTAEPTLSRTGATGTMAGEYTLQIQKDGCKSEVVSKVVEVVNLSNFTIVSGSPTNSICDGASLTLSVANFSGYSYQWKKDGGNVNNGTAAALQVGTSGSYTVVITASSVGNCSKTISPAAQVTSIPQPVADFKVPSPACTGNENLFEDASTVGAGASIAEYTWNFGPGGTSDLKSPAKVTFPVGTTNVEVTLTVKFKGVDGCLSTKTKPLIVNQTVIPAIEPSELAVCPEAPKDLSVTGTFQSVLWSSGATTPVLSVSEGGEFSVTTTDANGCKSTATRNVTALPVPVVEVTASSTTVASGEAVSLTATGAETWQWEPAESLDNATSATPVARPLVSTKFFATGFLKDGCSAKDSVEVQVDGDIKLPNVFSPNGDGVNDFWELPAVESFTDCVLSIFDRSGRRVFEQKGYSNNWDGNSGGKQLPEGVYYFIMGCPNRPPITGNIVLAR